MSEVKFPQPKAMRDTLLLSIHEAMLRDSEIFFLTADFGSPVLDKIRADCPDRFINVGIAEQNLINVSAGWHWKGLRSLLMQLPHLLLCAVMSKSGPTWLYCQKCGL